MTQYEKTFTINDLLACDSVLTARMVGSRVTCNPPPTDTDEDWLICAIDLPMFREEALNLGFHETSMDYRDEQNLDRFITFRRGFLNLIATADSQFFKKFITATEIAQKLNLMKKKSRIKLFQGVLYNWK